MRDLEPDGQVFGSGTLPPESSGSDTRPGPVRKPVLIILHQENSIPGHVGPDLVRLGHALDIRRPRFGDPLPRTMDDHDGAVIFGGPMSANDSDDFIRRETDWIAVPLKAGKPFLGICLGAQMLARHLGARVYFDDDERVGIGYNPIEPLEPPVAGVPWPTTVYQWHRQGFDLPAGARLMARAATVFPNQAFSYGSATAIQFHPEITYHQINRWTGNSPHRLAMKCAQDRPSQLRNHIAHAPAVHRWRLAFLRAWVDAGRVGVA